MDNLYFLKDEVNVDEKLNINEEKRKASNNNRNRINDNSDVPDEKTQPEQAKFKKIHDLNRILPNEGEVSLFGTENATFYSAISMDGRYVFSDKKEFVEFMNDPENVGVTMFLFDKFGTPPICLKKEADGFYLSEEAITAAYQLEEPSYLANKSIALKDIVTPSRIDFEMGKVAEIYKIVTEIEKNPEAYVKRFTDSEKYYRGLAEHTAFRELAQRHEKTVDEYAKDPGAFAENRPVFSFGDILAVILFKIITIGFGSTDKQKALAEYKEKKAEYDKKVETYENELEEFNDVKRHLHTEELDQKAEETQKARERAENIRYEVNSIKADYIRLQKKAAASREYDKNQLKLLDEYHSKTEVIMEGIADINKKGRITQDNIFAQKWLLKKNVEGLDPAHTDLSDMNNLASYVVCAMAEKKIYENYISNPDYAEGQMNRSLLEPINNGVATETMLKNPAFVQTYREFLESGKTIMPDDFVNSVEEKLREQLAKASDPLEKLNGERAYMEEKFGRQPVSKEVLPDIARYMYLMTEIEKFQQEKASGKIFDVKDTKYANGVVEALHANPGQVEFKKLVRGRGGDQWVNQKKSYMAPTIEFNIGEYESCIEPVKANEERMLKTFEQEKGVLERGNFTIGDYNMDKKYTLPEMVNLLKIEHQRQFEAISSGKPIRNVGQTYNNAQHHNNGPMQK